MKRKRFLIFLGFYLTLSGINVEIHDYFISSKYEEKRRELHQQVINKKGPAPIQYRILTHYLAELFRKAGLALRESYNVMRFIFTFLSALFFHIFLKKYFSDIVCFIGGLLLLATLPLTYLWYYMQPMDLPNLFFFILGCILIRERKDIYLYPLLFIAMLNRETAILLILVYLFYRWDELKLKDLVLRFSLLSLVGFGTYIGLRKYFGVAEYYSEAYYLGFNLQDRHAWIYTFLFFSVSLFFAWWKWNRVPKFLRRAALIIPFFIIIHWSMTIMREARLWLPLFPILFSLAMFNIFPEEKVYRGEAEVYARGTFEEKIRRFSGGLYLISLICFLFFFKWFFDIYHKLHLKERETQQKVERFINLGDKYLEMKKYHEAIYSYQQALKLNPKEAESHYRLARIYCYYLFDKERAVYHYEKTLELNPYHYDKKRIRWELSRLK